MRADDREQPTEEDEDGQGQGEWHAQHEQADADEDRIDEGDEQLSPEVGRERRPSALADRCDPGPKGARGGVQHPAGETSSVLEVEEQHDQHDQAAGDRLHRAGRGLQRRADDVACLREQLGALVEQLGDPADLQVELLVEELLELREAFPGRFGQLGKLHRHQRDHQAHDQPDQPKTTEQGDQRGERVGHPMSLEPVGDRDQQRGREQREHDGHGHEGHLGQRQAHDDEHCGDPDDRPARAAGLPKVMLDGRRRGVGALGRGMRGGLGFRSGWLPAGGVALRGVVVASWIKWHAAPACSVGSPATVASSLSLRAFLG